MVHNMENKKSKIDNLGAEVGTTKHRFVRPSPSHIDTLDITYQIIIIIIREDTSNSNRSPRLELLIVRHYMH